MSTISADMPGYPFGSVVPYCLDAGGAPVLLLSHLSQHTRNLLEEPRAALTVLGAVEGDVQQASRLTAIGRIRPLEDDTGAAGRYFRYFPRGRFYRESLNFRFFGLAAQRWHWNNGFATARWFANDRILRSNPFTAAMEAEAVARMEASQPGLPAHLLLAAGRGRVPGEDARVCGVDGEGMDLGAGDRLVRIPFPRPVTTPSELEGVLAELANRP